MKTGLTFLFALLVAVGLSQENDSLIVESGSIPKLSKFSITQEISGAVLFPSINAEFRFLSKGKWNFDARVGFGGLFQPDAIYANIIGLSTKYGSGESKLSLSLGASIYYQYGREQNDWDIWSEPKFYNQRYQYFLSLGYRYEQKHGFIFGVDAYAIGSFNEDMPILPIGETWQVYPWGGITFGYRFPSKELHSSWRKVRLLKRDKVSLLEQESGASLSSSKLNRIQRKSIREIERLEKESLRDLTRSAIYIEGFGAGLLWSLNYEYSFPLIKNELLQAFARTGVGVYPSRRRTDNQTIGFNVLNLPIIAGLRVMKNYRGGGVGGGIVPIVSEGRVRLGYVFNADLQIHITSGIIVGGGFNLLIGHFDKKPIYPWGGFYIGYRIRRMKP
ncbi:hypothetical protein N9J52_04305 [Flavobacteriales bacterium]|nr:hypothetical protein [Flavobacteriales bacterium]